MKLTLIVFLSVITLVICTVPEPFKEKGKGKCVCREKECTDVSCEEKNCLCIVKAVKNLLSQKDLKYPKKWLEYYLQIVQERCLCIQRCQNICNPKEFIECTSHAFDVFHCKFQKWLKGIQGDKGYNDFIKDINHILRACLNKDCKPICSGDSGCNPFYIEPKDCGCTKHCVQKFLEDLAKELENDDAAELVRDFIIYCISYYDQFLVCKKNPKEAQRSVCYSICRSEIDRTLDNLRDELIKAIGSCSAIGIISAIQTGVANCGYATV